MNKTKIITIIVVLVVGFIAIQYLSGPSTSSSSTLSVDIRSTDSTDAKYIYSLLQKMEQVRLEDSIFNNPVFQGLKDNSVSFPAQQAGRDNPFAPIGTDQVGGSQESSTGTN